MRNKFIRWIDACFAAGSYLSCLFMVLIIVLITVEIFVRTVFNFSTLLADEYSAYFFVAVVMSGLALTLRGRAHIRINRLLAGLGRRGERLLDMAVTLGAICLCTVALYHSGLMAYDACRLEMSGDFISQTTVYIPQIVIPTGFLLFDLQLIANLLRRLFVYPIS